MSEVKVSALPTQLSRIKHLLIMSDGKSDEEGEFYCLCAVVLFLCLRMTKSEKKQLNAKEIDNFLCPHRHKGAVVHETFAHLVVILFLA